MQKVKVESELYYASDVGLYYVISKSGAVYCMGFSKKWYRSERIPDYIKLSDEVLGHIKMRWVHVEQ